MGRVVIIGGGYAGLHAFSALQARLGREMARGEVEVTLISRDPYHTYHGWTGEVLSGRLPVERTLTPIIPLVGKHFLEGEVTSVDLKARTVQVRTADGVEDIDFEHLMVATGSRDPFERLPGLADHGWCIKNTRDMQKLVVHLDAAEERRAPLRDVVVVGGGFAGIEMASALALRFNRLGRSVAVHLVSPGEHLLDGLRPDFTHIAEHATEALRRQGVKVHLQSRVATVLPDSVAMIDGGTLPSDVTVAAAGVGFDLLPGTEALPRTKAGQLTTERSLQVVGAPAGIWASGDIAEVQHPVTGAPCPINALWAMKQGDCAGRNIARAIRGKRLQPFAFRGLGQAAGLGAQGGITELYRMQFTGRFAWFMRIFLFAWYMPSRRMGFSIFWDLLTNGEGRNTRVAAMPPRANAAQA